MFAILPLLLSVPLSVPMVPLVPPTITTGAESARLDRARIQWLLTADDRRVRTTDPRITAMLREGASRSRTFARLLDAVNRTDVIVYIQPVMHLPPGVGGRLMLLPVVEGRRYLRVQVRGMLPQHDLISIIAHELQHVLEVAGAPHVTTQASLADFYQRIGHRTTGQHTYDTAAAQLAGRRVRFELAG